MITYSEDIIEMALQQLETFRSRRAWREAGPRGTHLVRDWESNTVTIFPKYHRWYWSVRNDCGKMKFSKCGFETPDEAIEAIGIEFVRPL